MQSITPHANPVEEMWATCQQPVPCASNGMGKVVIGKFHDIGS